jgi:tRNA threonylcarbamoyladenosine biosynthesis protein TsaE
MDFISHSAAETLALGKMLASGLQPGSVILAYGDLGAGKTAFAKGVALGLGIKQIVNSPTFNIMKVYQGPELKLYHIDAYRLEDPKAVSDIGFDEAIGNPDGICYIEWPDYIASWFAEEENIISVRIVQLGEKTRKISIAEGRKA